MQDIPALLPQICNLLRLIWNLSGYFNNPERMTGLLRRCSNAIINSSTNAISLPEALQGDVEGVMKTLTVLAI